jgi:hypothetical protein
MRDQYNNVLEAYSINQLVTADLNGATVDLRGYGSAMVYIEAHQPVNTVSSAAQAQAWASGRKIDFSIEESDDATNWSAVAATDLQGTIAASATSGTDTQTHAVGYLPVSPKRYIRVKADVNSASIIGVSAKVVRGHPSQAPTR